ncbi:8-oxo-dGTP pyrophosphatase MutT and related house-cleaning NTP pyrophosphohydrolases, NUDIX family [Chelatococcus sambhunathii]|uniref:8-oxo-dGTP pyrophosphatase MutT and related house-cleaning NTP pyrophosphohydrolases, NUDIX family n=1 Tax=Chelatococcus sambhunathii TaxID=363953 RepID=A0ABM9TYV2_9HYPH|nr:8-oxo-dGTP pyrophosphatase MutT and related house-cleaning NTP pyrophosphohydrolases, NUDIX family [Chelatococcus sambhunathii]
MTATIDKARVDRETLVDQETFVDEETFLDRARRCLYPQPHGAVGAVRLRGDHDLAGVRPDVAADIARPAAVLVPIVTRSTGVNLLLTQRAAHLRQHSAQIAFPGGKMDPEDATPLTTALREAQEEIGLDRDHVRPLGYLDEYLSATGYRIVPVVGHVTPGFTLTVNREEVDEAFEVPLDFLMDAANHQRHSREWRGTLRHYYAMPFGERYIWGVTAGIIRNLYERLYGP